jgi:hypothetical protein
LPESLATAHGISAATAGCSLGFHPSRARRQEPWSESLPISSHALCGRARRRARRRPRVSIGSCPAPSGFRGKPQPGQSDPYRVFAPARSPTFGQDRRSAAERISIGWRCRGCYQDARIVRMTRCGTSGRLSAEQLSLPARSRNSGTGGDLLNTRDFWSFRSDFGSLDAQARRSERTGLCFN